MEQPETRVAYIRIDNLPPGKTWRQVKYLVGGMIHHTSILQVKMLPPVQSIVPPFIPFQSSIVSLKRSDAQLSRLLMELNGYTWEYYPLVAYAVPPLHVPSSAGYGEGLGLGFGFGSASAGAGGAHSAGDIPGSPHVPGSAPTPMMMPFTPMPAMYFPPLAQEPFARHVQPHGKKMRQVFSEESFRKQMSARGMWQLLLEGFPPCLHWDVNGADGATFHQSPPLGPPPAVHISTAHPEHFGKLKWTVLKDFIKLKCHKLLEMDNMGATTNTREFYVGVYEDCEVRTDVEIPEQNSDHKANGAEVSDKCLKEQTPETTATGSPTGSPTVSAEQELEEATQSISRLSVSSSHRVVSATVYKAIVGFHSRELCDMCRESLQDQEYSLGYKLKVTELPLLEW
ncbi:LAQU0S09e01046g1_1 [Lachancea quebecensis]|uniref:LAQU0S09e01046g1_1 n=1 Tax=Lachancea quebecensis TaxID=1654605 RepID=A0A0P1KTS3_9SACH|nr:LAQU0S09e01046g1_1 [Lachancea quebecensis]